MGNRSKRPPHRPRSKAKGPFARWIDSTGLTYAQLAERLGCSPQRISNLRNGDQKPGRALANTIAEQSKGAVPAEAWDP